MTATLAISQRAMNNVAQPFSKWDKIVNNAPFNMNRLDALLQVEATTLSIYEITRCRLR